MTKLKKDTYTLLDNKNTMNTKYIKQIILIFLIGGSAIAELSAQQDAMYSQYMYNTQAVNPAYAGSKDGLSVAIISRNQWVGFKGAPKTTSFSAHAPFLNKRLGLGLSYVQDEIGPTKISFFTLDLSARIKIHKTGYLAAGIKAGFDNQEVNLSLLNPSQQENIYTKDYKSSFKSNFGAGLYYYTHNYYIGLSSPRIIRNTIEGQNKNSSNIKRSERHFFLIGGYVMDINPDLKFKPSFMMKHVVGAPISFDLTAAFMIKERIIAGLAMRKGDSFGGVIQLRVAQQLWLGYAYDYTTSRLHAYNSGTHEILVAFDFGLSKNNIIKSPRFF